MEEFSIDDFREVMKSSEEQTGIVFCEMLEPVEDIEIPMIFINRVIKEGVNKKEEAILELNRILEIAKKAGSRIILYSKGTLEIEGEVAFAIEFLIDYGKVYLKISLNSGNFDKLAELYYEKRNREINDKLNLIKEVLERIFGSNDFDPKKFMEDTFKPYLEKNSIDYKKWPVNTDELFTTWLKETSGVENIDRLIDELVKNKVENPSKVDMKNEDPETSSDFRNEIFYGIFHKLESLLPHIYDDSNLSERIKIRTRINETSLEIYKGTQEIVDAQYVEEVKNAYLEYRAKLGIKKGKCTKEEIDAFLRYIRFELTVPREFLRDAIYELTNL